MILRGIVLFRSQLKLQRALLAIMLLASFLGVNCAANYDLDSRLRKIAKPYTFSIVKWELNAFFDGARKTLTGLEKITGKDIQKVIQFNSNVERIRALKSEIELTRAGSRQGGLSLLEEELEDFQLQNMEFEGVVEFTLERQIREVLFQEGIFNPVDKHLKIKIGFPPINFELEMPPHLLVISPRDRIDRIRGYVLRQVMTKEEMENIEALADELNVSSLVIELGGFAGTYPSFVTNEADLRFIIDTAAEEWLHHYLAFKPLGFQYSLHLIGILPDYEIATINETVAGIVSTEIGADVYKKYYEQDEKKAKAEVAGTGFDFNREMRNIRRAVDNYLSRGEIDNAEEFMEQRRQFLADNGYYIRKLNQAYFAFHGVYADKPTSISPIGTELKALRSRSGSLKQFLKTAAAMTSRQDLIDSLK